MNGTLRVADWEVAQGQRVQGTMQIPGTALQLPVTVINGQKAGKVFLLTAGVHGSEYPGVVAAIRLANGLTPAEIHGAVIILHAMNYSGLTSRTTYVLPEDGQNLNRAFPGDPNGSQSQRLAAFATEHFYAVSDCSVDLHAGDADTELEPHLYFPSICDPAVAEMSLRMARMCNVPYLVRSRVAGSMFSIAAKNGCPGLLLERGGGGAWCEDEVARDIEDVTNVLRLCGVLAGEPVPPRQTARVIEAYEVIDANCGGLWYPACGPGARVSAGQALGQIRDCFDRLLGTYVASHDGVLLYQTSTLVAKEGETLLFLGIC